MVYSNGKLETSWISISKVKVRYILVFLSYFKKEVELYVLMWEDI